MGPNALAFRDKAENGHWMSQARKAWENETPAVRAMYTQRAKERTDRANAFSADPVPAELAAPTQSVFFGDDDDEDQGEDRGSLFD